MPPGMPKQNAGPRASRKSVWFCSAQAPHLLRLPFRTALSLRSFALTMADEINQILRLETPDGLHADGVRAPFHNVRAPRLLMGRDDIRVRCARCGHQGIDRHTHSMEIGKRAYLACGNVFIQVAHKNDSSHRAPRAAK